MYKQFISFQFDEQKDQQFLKQKYFVRLQKTDLLNKANYHRIIKNGSGNFGE